MSIKDHTTTSDKKANRFSTFLKRLFTGRLFIQFLLDRSFRDVAKVTVDFSKTEHPSSMMGFLHSVEDTERIAEQWLQPLFAAPVSWRIRPNAELVERTLALGVEKPIVVVSDTWNGLAPAQDWGEWEEHVRKLAQEFGTDVIYDIVNEPDMPFFWTNENGHDFPSGWADFHETFRRAHDVIREELREEAIISGPSFSFLRGSKKRLYAFMRFCHENELVCQILSIHTIYQSDIRFPSVARIIRKFRRDFIESGKYAGAGVKEIHVNEYGLPNDYCRPGTIAAMLRQLELSGADAANRATWGVRVETIDNALDGYLKFGNPDAAANAPIILGDIMFSDNEPRPVWWVYQYYAAGVASRVHAKSSSKFLMPVASAASDVHGQAQIIIGATASNVRLVGQEIDLKLEHLEKLPFLDAESDTVTIEVKKIVNDETIPLVTLPTVLKQQVTVVDGTAGLRLPLLGNYDAHVVMIRGE